MPASDLLVYTKTENLLFRLYPVLVNYPKAEKFALSQQIKECLYNTLRCISLGNSVKSKRLTYLQEADGYLQLTEINKLLSGYIKSVNK